MNGEIMMFWFRALVCLLLPAAVFAMQPRMHIQYAPTWESLDSRPLPSWFDDAKFGIFIHWGVYSVPSFSRVGDYAEWYWKDLMDNWGNNSHPTYKFHVKNYGAGFKYQQFAANFRAELFDADEWMKLIKRSGARYVVPTSKHHEGFTLWPSKTTPGWNALEVGPRRDLLGEMRAAADRAGVRFGLYYSVYEWYNQIYRSTTPQRYVTEVLHPQLRELVLEYGPDVLFADGEWEQNSDFWRSREFLAWLYNESPVRNSVVVNDRWGNDTRNRHGAYYTPEYSPDVYLHHKWEQNSGLDVHSFGLNRATPAEQYATTRSLVHLLVRCVANNGNLLLDIGPAADGTIPTLMQERLLQIGAWLDVNGDAIYGTRIWRIQHEGSDIDKTSIRYTAKKSTVYGILLAWPIDSTVTLEAPVPTNSTSVSLLGLPPGKRLKWEATRGIGKPGLRVMLPTLTPQESPCSHAWVLELQGVH